MSYPLLQRRQATLLDACGFPCQPAGEQVFNGVAVPMWKPTGERRQAVADLLGYGGAAFGGKSFALLALARMVAELWEGTQIAYFRRTYNELDGPGAAMQKAYELFGGVAHVTDGGREWNWDNGSALYFRHAQHERDVYKYQSQQMDVLLMDEATHNTWFIVDYLLTRNRVSGEVGEGFRPFAVMPSNPGNIGHVWYSQIFDVEKNLGEHEQVKRTGNPNGKTQEVYFIPAFLEDNQIGVARDPGYEGRLMERDPEVARALRYGDWGIFAGQAFPTWNYDRVACDAFPIPDHWARWRAVDYGYVHPWAAAWFAKDPQTERVYIYRAILKSGLTDTEQARLLRDMTPPTERITATFASPDMWARKSAGTRVFTSVDEYRDEGVILQRADNDRVNGKRKIDRLLLEMPDGLAGIQVFREFYDVFKCMTSLVRGKNVEDVEKIDGDDAYDMLRYGLTNINQPQKERGEVRKAHPLRGNRAIW